MILSIAQGNECRVVRLPDEDEMVPLLGTQIRVQHSGTRFSFRASDPMQFHASRNPLEENRILVTRPGMDETAEIDISFHDERYDRFSRYVLAEGLTLGSSAQDSIFLQDPDIPAGKIMFHPSCNTLEVKDDGAFCALNHQKISGKIFWKPGDLLQILNVQIIFGYGFIAVSQADNLIVNAEVFVPVYVETEDENHAVVVHRSFQNPKLSLVFEAQLDEPDEIRTRNERPLVFTMGPALTMSTAALAGGLWSGYNSWLSGKELAEILPLVMMPAVMVLSTILWTPLQRWYEKKEFRDADERRSETYLTSLKTIESDITAFKDDYAMECLLSFPGAMKCLSHPDLLWQKTPERSDWMLGALGMGTQTFDLQLQAAFHLKRTDPLKDETEAMIARQSARPDTLLLCPMQENRRILYKGSREYLLHLLMDFCSQYGPDQVRLVVLGEESFFDANPWLRMIPQCMANDGTRTLASSEAQAREVLLCLEQEQPQAVLLYSRIALLTPLFAPVNPILVYDMDDGTQRSLELHFDTEHMEGSMQSMSYFRSFHADNFHTDDPMLFFHRLNDFHLEKDMVNVNRYPTFLDSYDAGNADELPLRANWISHHNSRELRMPLGFSDRGEMVYLDLDEKGHGPHGLIAGTTGSGKSELIITLVLGLITEYSPRDVQFVMIDFKGGGATALFSNETYEIPHMAGVLSNLQPSGMERALVSFKNECLRRESLFQQMGTYLKHPVSNLYDYKQAWKKESGLPELASLVIIVDEFAELKKEEPEFMKELISIARVGRSLGIHMILATQKPSGVVDDQIWANTHFKICMKVSSKQDSNEMIHVPDASYIHRAGEYYLLCDDLLTHAYCPYASGKEGKKKEAALIGLNGSRLDAKAISAKGMTQAFHTVSNIMKLSEKMPGTAMKLWLPMLQEQRISELDPGVFLQMDDYQNKLQPYVSIHDAGLQHLASFTNDRKEKLQFLNSLLYAVLSSLNAEDEVYVINDVRMDSADFMLHRNVCEVMESDSQERIRLLEERSRNESRKGIMNIIITDLSHFLAVSDEDKAMFHWWLEKGEQHRIRVFFMASNANAVPYKDLSLVSARLALHNENPQDLSAIFEKPVKHAIREPHAGKFSRKGIHDVMYAAASKEDMHALCAKNAGEKVHSFPSIPDFLDWKSCPKEGIPIGMDMQSYEWVMKPEGRNLVVMAMYEEELDEMRTIYSSMDSPCLYLPSEKELEDSADGVVILTYRMYQDYRLKNDPLFTDVLFVGSGLAEQNLFYPKDRSELKPHTGVYVSRGRQRRVHHVESKG